MVVNFFYIKYIIFYYFGLVHILIKFWARAGSDQVEKIHESYF